MRVDRTLLEPLPECREDLDGQSFEVFCRCLRLLLRRC